MNIPIDLMIYIIRDSSECKAYLEAQYTYEYSIWVRFSSKNGDQCPLARAALKRIATEELKLKSRTFLDALASQAWGSKLYQETEKHD